MLPRTKIGSKQVALFGQAQRFLASADANSQYITRTGAVLFAFRVHCVAVLSVPGAAGLGFGYPKQNEAQ